MATLLHEARTIKKDSAENPVGGLWQLAIDSLRRSADKPKPQASLREPTKVTLSDQNRGEGASSLITDGG